MCPLCFKARAINSLFEIHFRCTVHVVCDGKAVSTFEAGMSSDLSADVANAWYRHGLNPLKGIYV